MAKEKVEIELSANSAKLKSEFDAARAKVMRFKNGVKDAMDSMGGLGRVLSVAAVGAGLKGAIGDATDLGETISKSREIFKQHSEQMEQWSEGLADGFGQARASALGAAADFGAVFNVLGVGQQESAEMSKKLVELASDMASFNNTSVEQALGAIGAGLRGESEPLRKYAVLLNDATLRAEAMKMGLYDGKGVLDIQTKSLAAYNVILAQTGAAQGDFARTSEGAANSQRILQARLQNISAELGQALLPLYVGALRVITDNHRAILAVVAAIAAYKAAKFSVALAKDIAAVIRTGVALLAAKAATDMETRAVAKNTAVLATNTLARRANDAAAMRNAGTKAGASIAGAVGAELATSTVVKKGAEKMGKKAASTALTAAAAALAAKAPQAAAALAVAYGGFQLGKFLGGDKFADDLAENFEKAFKKANAEASSFLSTTHQMVTTAQTVEQTAAARLKITAQIAWLEKQNLTLGEGQRKSANSHAIATLKIWERTADTHRIRNLQKKVEEDISAEYDFQLRQQTFSNKMAQEAIDAAKQRAAATEKAADAMRTSMRSLKAESVGGEIDLLPGEKRVKIFTDSLQKGIKAAVAEFNFGRKGKGKETAGADKESMAGIYALAQKAEAEGDIGLAKSLYEQLKRLQEIQGEIRKGKDDSTRATEEEAEKQRAALDLTARRKETMDEMRVLQLRLAGDNAGADALREEIDLRREAKGVAEDLQITEASALKMLQDKAALNRQVSQSGAKKELAEELRILQLQASGQMKKAEQMERELRLRREAADIAAATGVSEQEALRIAIGRDKLRTQAGAAKDAEAGENGGRKRSKLYNAQESLQRRLARQSKTDSRQNITQADRLGLKEKFTADKAAANAARIPPVLKGNAAVPGKLDELIVLEQKMVKIFDNMVKV